MTMTIQIIPRDAPSGHVADAELHFAEGPLAGLKLIGFGIWEKTRGQFGSYTVTFPARQYTVNGERRSFALLRPLAHDAHTEHALRDQIIEAYRAFAAPVDPA